MLHGLYSKCVRCSVIHYSKRYFAWSWGTTYASQIFNSLLMRSGR